MRLADFLPPIVARAFGATDRKELSGSIDFLPGVAAFLNPDEPTYRTARSYDKMAQHGYGGNVYLYRAVSIIAQAIAGIPWRVFKETAKGDRQEQERHPLAHLLNVAANDEDTGPDMLAALVSYQLLAGVAYLWVVRPDTGNRPPTAVYALQPNLLQPLLDTQHHLTGWEYRVGSYTQQMAVDDVLRVKEFHPLSRGAGLGPATVAARAIDQHNSANDWNTALMQNMARPSGLLTPKDATIIPPDVHATLKEELRERYQGARNAGRPLVPRAPMQWQPMGQNATELDWLNGKIQAAREIAVALGVPPELLGDHANATYSNFVEARRSFYTETVLPRLDHLKATLGRFLLPMYGLDPEQYVLDYDRDDIEALQEDRDAQHDRARKDYAGGLITLNEARRAIGEADADNGDFYLAPPRAMTVDQLLEGAGLPGIPDGTRGAQHPGALPPHLTPGMPTALPPGQIVDANQTPPATPPPAAKGQRAPKGKALIQTGDEGAPADRPGEAALRRTLAARFTDEHDALAQIAAECERDGVDLSEATRRVVAAVPDQRDAWRDVLAVALLTLASRAGTRQYQAFTSQADLSPDDAGAYDATSGLLADALGDEYDVPDLRAGQITDTTRDWLRAAMVDVLTAGTFAALTAALANSYDAWGDWRADGLASDWWTYADSLGMADAAGQFPIPDGMAATRTWVSMHDAKVRPAHAEADGQTVGMDEPYVVGGEELQYPGDPNGSAENVANCRCTEDYTLA